MGPRVVSADSSLRESGGDAVGHHRLCILLAACLVLSLVQPVEAKVRIYGGPVPSVFSGRYYPPGGWIGGPAESVIWVKGNPDAAPGKARRSERQIDLNPRFVPGTAFVPPGYVPSYFPRTIYFADDYIGYYSGSAVDR
ncbi:hypothetical protein SH661x_000865 [Planctomicrobium sp. SH661]|uniref:hypothetical protein n=1 Tax=Planctomicrobium sp. SH661 TaxID=3448124 RepID=UPI003F5AF892